MPITARRWTPVFLVSLAASLNAHTPTAPRSQPPMAARAVAPAPGTVTESYAAWPSGVTLGDLGYSTDVQLKGPSAALSVGFPLPTRGITGGQLTLSLQLSPVLSPASTLRVLIDERVVATRTVGDLRVDSIWRVPVGAVAKPQMSVRLETAMTISSNRCDDDASGNLWVMVGRNSTLAFQPQPGAGSVRDFFRFPGGRIEVAGAWDTPERQAATMALFSVTRWMTRGLPIRVELASGSGQASSSQSGQDSRRGVRTVLLSDTPPAIRREGNTLYVRADARTLTLLASSSGASALLGPRVDSVKEADADQAAATCGPKRVCLSDLGVGDRTVSGIGSLRTSFSFTPASLGGWPTSLAFTVDAAFDRVPTDTLERAVARIWMNGALLETFDIRGRTTLTQAIGIPAALVEPSNLVEVELAYAPVSGNCQGTPYAFTGQLRGSSFLSWTGLGPLPRRLAAVVAAAPSPAELYLADAPVALAQAMTRVVGTISAQATRPIVPVLKPAGEFARSTAALRLVATRTPAVLPGLTVAFSLAEPVEIRNRHSGRVLMRSTPRGSLAALELIEGRPTTLVLQATPSASDDVLESFVETALDPQRVHELLGPVVVGNGDEVIALRFGSGGVDARPEGTTRWERFVVQLRLLWYLLAAAIVIALLAVTYRRLGRRPPVS